MKNFFGIRSVKHCGWKIWQIQNIKKKGASKKVEK